MCWPFVFHAMLTSRDVRDIRKMRWLSLFLYFPGDPSFAFWRSVLDGHSPKQQLSLIQRYLCSAFVDASLFYSIPVLRKQTLCYCCYIGCNTSPKLISYHQTQEDLAWRNTLYGFSDSSIRLSVDTVIDLPKIQMLDYKQKVQEEIKTEQYAIWTKTILSHTRKSIKKQTLPLSLDYTRV